MKLYPNVSIIFCIWAASLLTIFYFGFSSLPHSGLFSGDFIRSFANWDGGHYLGIADGYDKSYQHVFFPLYPLLINLVSKLTGSLLTAGILISVVSTFLGVNLLYRLIEMEFGRQYALKGVLALLFFPMSFHFLTVYTEGLFFLLTVATFLFLRREKILLATIAAALASGTRLVGLAVVLGLFAHVYFTKGINRRNWFVLFAPVGFIFYTLYLYNQTGDPFYFISAESNFWQSGLVFPGSAIIHSLKQLIIPGFFLNNFRLELFFTLFGLIMIWLVSKRLSLDYTIFSVVSFLLPLFSPTLAPMPRYLLTIFPIFIVLSFYKNQYALIFYQLLSLMLLPIYAILFLNGFWVS